MLRRVALTMILLALFVPRGAAATSSSPTQHIWLHYDYMVAADGRSDAPDPRSIQLVVDAFASHGIALQIDPKHAAIPERKVILFDEFEAGLSDCPGSFNAAEIVKFSDLKAQYFHPAANHEWHYAIFGRYVNCNRDTGHAQLPGDDFAVGLGDLRDLGVPITPTLEGGVFMHELGHNLGLHHGGNVNDNNKSNYLSVMNYSFIYGGIPYASALGSTSIAGRRLDYSGQALAPLDEAHLNETLGIGAGTTDITLFEGPTTFGPGAASGPIDWNQNGFATETDVAVDIDISWDELQCTGPPCGSDFDVQTGFDDWAEVHAYLAGTFNPGPKTFEHENRASEPLVATVSPNVGPLIGGTTVTITGAHFDKTTAVSFGGQAASFTVVNDGTLAAISPPGSGTVDVIVIAGANPSPSMQSDQFTYVPPPTISSVAPASGPPGGGMNVTVKGTNLSGATSVLFGPNPAASFSVVDDSTISAVTPPGIGTVDVAVTTAIGGTSPTGVLDRFTYVQPLPNVTSLSPTSGFPGIPVTIHGSALTGATQVCFGGTCLVSLTVVDDSTITLLVPLSPLEGSTVDVTVTTPAGTSPTGPTDLFTLL